ncbi:head GIN domain-containing protein [Flagellimonas profundi]|uniref:head GIN domain-containing protein n=1 Tax=Flagellimonas profundi TaxID=2915620 RepID=UPI001F3DF7FB|nr:head GIN domain-containing protein [Allomuricauda profundi]
MNSISSAVERYFSLAILLLLVACNGDNVPDCFQNAGEMVRRPVDVSQFNSITVFENLNVVLKQGDNQMVEVETGEYLLKDVSAVVEDNRLVLRNENSCNYVRDYGLTTVYVTSPNISEIRSSTGLPITSDGVLNYPSLSLVSESFNNPEAETTDGSFDLNLNTSTVRIVVNGIAYFKLKGTTENFNVTVAAGDSRIEAEELVAENVIINHRGSNDAIVNPQQSLSGIIRGTGDVISVNRPSEVAVEELFNGRLIFQD